MDALLKDSEHLAAMIDNVASVDNLDFIMESDALGHVVMDQRQGHASLVAVAGTITLEEVSFTINGDPNYEQLPLCFEFPHFMSTNIELPCYQLNRQKCTNHLGTTLCQLDFVHQNYDY